MSQLVKNKPIKSNSIRKLELRNLETKLTQLEIQGKNVKVTPVYNTYWQFATERQNIFFSRLINPEGPWTNDEILRKYKFTNAYRASDRVSQFLIKNVIYNDSALGSDLDTFFRIILFKMFNKIETWQLLERSLGEEINYKGFAVKKYNKILENAKNKGETIYSAAYIMPSGLSAFGYEQKHKNHLLLIEKMLKDNLLAKIMDSNSMQAVFKLLLNYPTIGNFLAYQLATDINYSELTSFSESEFVEPGPGAKDGIKKCFSNTAGLSDTEIIHAMVDIQDREFERLGLEFKSLWGRKLQLIDCQNLFCEVGKYARKSHPEISGVSDRNQIKQIFKQNQKPIIPFYPPKWNLNQKITESLVIANKSVDNSDFALDKIQQSNKSLIQDDVNEIQLEMDLPEQRGYVMKKFSKKTLLKWQKDQFKHDSRNHTDVVFLHRFAKLRHYGLHFAKYVGRLARGKREEKSIKQTVIDTLLVCLSSANTMTQELDEVKSTKGFKTNSEELKNLADFVGTFTDACEKIDHFEEFVKMAKESNQNILSWVLKASIKNKINIPLGLKERRKELAKRQFYIED